MRNHKQSDRVLNLPAGYFGIVLGTIGMGFAALCQPDMGNKPLARRHHGDLAMIIWALLTTAFLSRLVRFPHSVMAEVRHPVMSSFVSLFPATTMLVAIGFVPGIARWPLRYSAWGSSYNWRMPHGRRRDFGAERIRKKRQPRGFICPR